MINLIRCANKKRKKVLKIKNDYLSLQSEFGSKN